VTLSGGVYGGAVPAPAVGRAGELLRRLTLYGGPAVALVAVALLVSRYDAPLVLGALLAAAAGVALLWRPEIGTVAMVFLLYTNIPVLSYKYYGVPQAVAGAFLLLLLFPLAHHVLGRRERLRADQAFALMLAFLAVLLVGALRARDSGVATAALRTYAIEGLLLYWLVINAVRTLPALRRVIWTMLAAGALLGSLSLYQEVTGDFRQQFGGLAHRNYSYLLLQEQVQRDPDDALLLEQKRLSTDGRSARAEGPLDEPNTYAQILLVLLPLALHAYRSAGSRLPRLAAAAFGFAILGGVAVTYSRGALVAVALALLAAVALRWIRPRQILIGALALVALVPVVASDYLMKRLSGITTAAEMLQGSPGVERDVAIQGRATQMLAALQVFIDHPVLGVGPGQYAPMYSLEYQQRNPRFKFRDIQVTRRAHSLYLEMAAETGAIGLGVFLAIAGVLLRGLWRARRAGGPMADLATALFLSVFSYLAAGIFLHLAYQRYYWLLLAVAGSALLLMRAEQRLMSGAGNPAMPVVRHGRWAAAPIPSARGHRGWS
jgi:putative inorganic carbon (hco3(-)) transporter